MQKEINTKEIFFKVDKPLSPEESKEYYKKYKLQQIKNFQF